MTRLKKRTKRKAPTPPDASVPRVSSREHLERELDVHREELTAQNDELRQAMAALTTSRERYARLYDVAPVGFFTVAPSGQIAEANLTGAALLRLPRNMLWGRSLDDFFAPGQLARLRSQRSAAFAGRLAEGLDASLVVAGRTTPVRVTVAPIGPTRAGVVECLVCISDETARHRVECERRALESRAAEADRLESLSRLAGGIAHDFDDLLSVVLTHTELALDAADRDQVSGLTMVRAAATQCAELSRQMLAYCGHEQLVSEPIDLSVVLHAVGSLLRANVAPGTALDLELGADVPPIWGDRVQVQRIALNLVRNAAESIGPRGGRIVVRTRREEASSVASGASFAVLEVIDDGPGMDDETRRRAFDPFFSTKLAGRGLGLAVVHGSVRAHGGAIAIASEVGQGASFVATFPVMEAIAAPTVGPPMPRPSTRRGPGR